MITVETPTWHAPEPNATVRAVRVVDTDNVYVRDGSTWHCPALNVISSWGNLIEKGVVAAQPEDAYPLPWEVPLTGFGIVAANGAQVLGNDVGRALLLQRVNGSLPATADQQRLLELCSAVADRDAQVADQLRDVLDEVDKADAGEVRRAVRWFADELSAPEEVAGEQVPND